MSTVLIVDDVTEIHELIRSALEPTGVTSLHATSLDEALQLYDEHQPKLVVADVRIQPESGYDLLAKLQARNPEARVVLMSGYKGLDERREALEAGALDYWEKPFALKAFVERIRLLVA